MFLINDFRYTWAVWKELEKENREFFETYKKDRGGESPSQKGSPSDQASTSRSSDDNDDD